MVMLLSSGDHSNTNAKRQQPQPGALGLLDGPVVFGAGFALRRLRRKR
jgi:hypothetical protein